MPKCHLDGVQIWTFVRSFPSSLPSSSYPPPTFSKVAVFESFLRSPRFFLGSLSLVHVDEINFLDDRELYDHIGRGNVRERRFMGCWLSIDWVCWLESPLIGADENSLPGVVCGTWTEFKIIGNSNPGTYEFNCVPTPDEIDANAHNNGFFIGGLNHEGVTMALCHIEYSGNELCDSDTVSDANDEACNVWVVCE
ncbi:hypothetical protein C8R42DRAFT_441056 [Lentinula raphanica]|nr:hypothetical protein C8R42DRAFT_441056 [Lentinula raphanica]